MNRKRFISMLLSVAMVLNSFLLSVFATETECTHHTEHTADCGYVAAVEGEDCTHVHDEACGYAEAVEEVPCACTETDENGQRIHTENCGYSPEKEAVACDHIHDENCGYKAAVEGVPCSFVCEECKAEQEPKQEPAELLTITAWNWVDEYEILSEDGTYATLPHAADWETLKSILPTITATVDGTEVTVPVEWECENFPAEGAAQGTFQLKAVLPEGYTLGEGVAALELEVDLGVADMLDTWVYPTSTPTPTWTGSGTAADPYVITTAQQLADFAWLVNNNNSSFMSACYKLNNEIDLSEGTWTPIGYHANKSGRYFKGTFDGGSHTISGLNDVTCSGTKYVGLFGAIQGGTVKNLTVSGTFTTTYSSVAGICAYASQATFENCVNQVNITCTSSSSPYLGGIVGYGGVDLVVRNCKNHGTISYTGNGTGYIGGICGMIADGSVVSGCSNSGSITGKSSGNKGTGGIVGFVNGTASSTSTEYKVENCTNSGVIRGTNYAGGIVGCSNSEKVVITGCSNTAAVTGSGYYVGGICGIRRNIITHCYNSGNVTGTYNVGGICGSLDQKNYKLSNCYNTGSITATAPRSDMSGAGGIEGYTAGARTATFVYIDNCYNTGTVSGVNGDSQYIGGICGRLQTGILSNCHSYGTITNTSSNTTYCGAIAGGYGTIINSYYLNGTDKKATQKSSDEFADGTVYNLLAANNSGVWGQTIDVDHYPVFFNGSNIPVIKEAVTVSVTAVTTYTYDGTAKSGYTGTPTSGAYTGTLEYVYAKVNADGSTTPLTEAPKDAGTYTLVVKVPDSAENYKGKSDSITFTIQPKEIGITWDTTEFTYNGQEQAPTATATELIDGDTCTITVTGGQTNVGTNYTAKATAVNNTNYKLPEAGVTTTFNINAAQITEVTLAADSVEVSDSAQTPTISAVKAGELTLSANDYTVSYKDSADQTVTEMKNVGTYTVVVTAKNDSNFSGSKEVEWKITKAKSTITTVPTVAALTYGQTLAQASIAGGVASVEGTFSFKEPTTTPTVADSNKTEYTLIFTPKDTDNYDPVETKVMVTVNPKEIGIEWGNTTLTYNASEQAPTATATDIVNGDAITLTVDGAKTNAGTDYTATVTGITGDKAANYKLPTNVTTTFEIKNASQTAPTVTGVNETVANKADGKITGVNSTMEYRKDGESTYTAITGTEVTGLAAGTYYVRYAEKDNYDASPDTTVEIGTGIKLTVTIPAEQTGYTLTADTTEVNYGGSVTLTYSLAEGYTEGEGFAVTATNCTVTKNDDGTYKLSNITDDVVVSVAGVSDTSYPTAEIRVENNVWKEFLNNIMFGTIFRETKTVTITAADIGSGVQTIQYFLSSQALNLEQMEDIDSWAIYEAPFNIDPNNKYVIYVKVQDIAGNVTYISSDGIVVETWTANSTDEGNEDDEDNDNSVTITISGDEKTIKAKAAVSGKTATVLAPSTTQLNRIIAKTVKTGTVEIDLSSLDKDISKVNLPIKTLEAIVKAAEELGNDTEAMKVILPNGLTAEFDDKALRAIIDQVKCDQVSLVVEKTGTKRLNNKQKAAIEDLDVYGGYEAYLYCPKANKRISDFKGGVATLSVPFTVPTGKSAENFSVWYVSDSGKLEQLSTWYSSKKVNWDVSHFSDFIITYNANTVVKENPNTGAF